MEDLPTRMTRKVATIAPWTIYRAPTDKMKWIHKVHKEINVMNLEFIKLVATNLARCIYVKLQYCIITWYIRCSSPIMFQRLPFLWSDHFLETIPFHSMEVFQWNGRLWAFLSFLLESEDDSSLKTFNTLSKKVTS